MGTIFSDTLVKLRTGAGFKTAYSFFQENGGKSVLGISYRKYLLLEQGKNLPALSRLTCFSYALRLVPQGPEANALAVAWLKTFAGDDVYREVLAPLVAPKAEARGMTPLHDAMKKNLSEKRYFLTPDQYRAILSSYESYLCYQALSNETASWKAEELAKTLRLDKTGALAGLKALKEVKLVKEPHKGVFSSPLAGMQIDGPQFNLLEASFRAKNEEYHKRLVESGTSEWVSTCLLRADGEVFKGYLPLMNLNMQAAGVYAISKKTPSSALFMIESRLTRLRDF
ncbi:MAG: hypothetical protein COT17_06185 [Elusimicrobia bacterium CG08_land_8_20_14_0_20_51_18]|nr:MAG: hypothetical protein COT17_06185 [Elusimicrobia bacterium CG08_land_8_20_14_0_20_51_18]